MDVGHALDERGVRDGCGDGGVRARVRVGARGGGGAERDDAAVRRCGERDGDVRGDLSRRRDESARVRGERVGGRVRDRGRRTFARERSARVLADAGEQGDAIRRSEPRAVGSRVVLSRE